MRISSSLVALVGRGRTFYAPLVFFIHGCTRTSIISDILRMRLLRTEGFKQFIEARIACTVPGSRSDSKSRGAVVGCFFKSNVWSVYQSAGASMRARTGEPRVRELEINYPCKTPPEHSILTSFFSKWFAVRLACCRLACSDIVNKNVQVPNLCIISLRQETSCLPEMVSRST